MYQIRIMVRFGSIGIYSLFDYYRCGYFELVTIVVVEAGMFIVSIPLQQARRSFNRLLFPPNPPCSFLKLI